MADVVARHYLVWLDAAISPAELADLDEGTRAVVADWFARGLPAVARRRGEGDPTEAIPLGIPLSPLKGKRRIALNAPAGAVHEIRPPLMLGEAVESAPLTWRTPLAELDANFEAAGLQLRVYGSLAWQHITQETYVTDRSDVDLLFRLESVRQLEWALVLQDWERRTGLHADGEVLLPDGAGVAWRELLRARGRVLVKSVRSLELQAVSELWRAFDLQTV